MKVMSKTMFALKLDRKRNSHQKMEKINYKHTFWLSFLQNESDMKIIHLEMKAKLIML